MTPRIGIFGAGYPEYGPDARRLVPIGWAVPFISSNARFGNARACIDVVFHLLRRDVIFSHGLKNVGPKSQNMFHCFCQENMAR